MKMLMRVFMLSLLMSLSACGDSGVGELNAWMDQVKKETRVYVPPISEPKIFLPVAYDGDGLIDPFDAAKLLVVFARLKEANDNGLKPNFDRPREALEAYPIDGMTMVGTIESKGIMKALVRVGTTTFAVTVGSYIGQNFGRIIGITDSKVDLVETIQDASGEWVERKATLEKQEAR